MQITLTAQELAGMLIVVWDGGQESGQPIYASFCPEECFRYIDHVLKDQDPKFVQEVKQHIETLIEGKA